MSLIYIQQRSYHYIILCVDGSVIRCLYLDVDGSGMAHADMVYVMLCLFVCMYTVSMRPNLNLVRGFFFKGCSQPPLVPFYRSSMINCFSMSAHCIAWAHFVAPRYEKYE